MGLRVFPIHANSAVDWRQADENPAAQCQLAFGAAGREYEVMSVAVHHQNKAFLLATGMHHCGLESAAEGGQLLGGKTQQLPPIAVLMCCYSVVDRSEARRRSFAGGLAASRRLGVKQPSLQPALLGFPATSATAWHWTARPLACQAQGQGCGRGSCTRPGR